MKGIVIAVLVTLALAAPLRAGWDEGVAALERQDYQTALKEFRSLAEQGDPDGQVGLAVMYAGGLGVVQDHVQAAHWYRLAAEQGVATAQFELGYLYYRGSGVEQDYAQAAVWIERAARQGDREAQHVFAFMHALAEGVPGDFVQAYAWFALAAAQASGEAAEGVYLVAESMSASEIAEAVRIAEAWIAESGFGLGLWDVPALDVLAPLGARANPVRVDGPSGEHAYLGRLRCPEGDAPWFERRGSVGDGPYGRIMDVYDLWCAGGDRSAEIYMDMYHPDHREHRAVPDFTILSLQTPDE